jgi:hypothetical protein
MRPTLYIFASMVLVGALAAVAPASYAANDVALVTALRGNVNRVAKEGPGALEAFVKLRQGDVLTLEKGSTVKLVYFSSARQESWTGEGRLEIAANESKGTGLADPEVKILPAILVKQIARTPSLDSQGRAGVMRLRAIATPDAIAKLDREYTQMRTTSELGDINPEIFLLSGLFDMRELDRVEALIGEMEVARKNELEARVLVSLYRKALKNVRESK